MPCHASDALPGLEARRASARQENCYIKTLSDIRAAEDHAHVRRPRAVLQLLQDSGVVMGEARGAEGQAQCLQPRDLRERGEGRDDPGLPRVRNADVHALEERSRCEARGDGPGAVGPDLGVGEREGEGTERGALAERREGAGAVGADAVAVEAERECLEGGGADYGGDEGLEACGAEGVEAEVQRERPQGAHLGEGGEGRGPRVACGGGVEWARDDAGEREG